MLEPSVYRTEYSHRLSRQVSQERPGTVVPRCIGQTTGSAVDEDSWLKRPDRPHRCVPHCLQPAHGTAVMELPVSTIRSYGCPGSPKHTMVE